MGKYGSVSVGRENDRRWKLSPEDIRDIKRMRRRGETVKQIAVSYAVNINTIRYWTELKYQQAQRLKNAKRRRSQAEERDQTACKQLRRNIVRHKVRKYTAKQMQALRKSNPEHYRALSRKSVRLFRMRHPDRARASQRRWWHRHKCKCHKRAVCAS